MTNKGMVVDQRTWDWRVRALNKRDFLTLYFIRGIEGKGWQVANEIAKPQVTINSNNSSVDCSLHCKKTASLQPEIEINEYSSRKKLLE